MKKISMLVLVFIVLMIGVAAWAAAPVSGSAKPEQGVDSAAVSWPEGVRLYDEHVLIIDDGERLITLTVWVEPEAYHRYGPDGLRSMMVAAALARTQDGPRAWYSLSVLSPPDVVITWEMAVPLAPAVPIVPRDKPRLVAQ